MKAPLHAVTDTEEIVIPDDHFDRARRLLDRLEQQIALMSNPVAGTCAVFHEDEAFEIALPWAAFENYQFKIASRHAAPDPMLYTQLFDLIPSLAGKALLDIGAFTGLQGLIMRRFLEPSQLLMVEPQAMMQKHLGRTIAANPEGCPVTLLKAVIDDGTSVMQKSATRHERLADTSYLRRDSGKISATTIDALGLTDLGLINLDIPGAKIYALKGAEATLRDQRPPVLVNLSGRDATEIKEFMEPLGYEFVRLGNHGALLLPH